MSFEWTDGDGRLHVLTSFAPIVAAANAVATEIDRLIPDIENDEYPRSATPRGGSLAPLQAKLERLAGRS